MSTLDEFKKLERRSGSGWKTPACQMPTERDMDAMRIAGLEEENRRLRSLLVKARDEFKGLPHSLGYEFTHLPEIDEALKTPNA